MKSFDLTAKVSTEKPEAVKPILDELIGANGNIQITDGGFEIKAKLEGQSARDLNRVLLSTMRRAEKKTRLRSEWTNNKSVERFFDYVPKGVRQID